jgi:quinol monooxygenase YgiN
MASIFVKHKVNDYASWKRVYDDFASYRKQNGVTAASVHRDPDDPTMIIVMHRFGDVNAAQNFLNSDELRAAMANAGVSGQPEIWLTEDVEQTPY